MCVSSLCGLMPLIDLLLLTVWSLLSDLHHLSDPSSSCDNRIILTGLPILLKGNCIQETFSPIRRSLKGFLLGSNYIGDLSRGFQGAGSPRNRLRPGSPGLQARFPAQILRSKIQNQKIQNPKSIIPNIQNQESNIPNPRTQNRTSNIQKIQNAEFNIHEPTSKIQRSQANFQNLESKV